MKKQANSASEKKSAGNSLSGRWFLKGKPFRYTTGGTFPIVGIGASAGGLEAIEQFLKHVPVDSGMAYIVVQHLDPTHK